MARSKIEWLARPGTIPESWNPVRARRKCDEKVGWFCTKKSPGCLHCYAERMNKRFGTGLPYDARSLQDIDIYLDEVTLEQSLHWRKPRTVFVMSMSDFFHYAIPTEYQCRILQVIGKCPQHTFIILTKREEQLELWNHNLGWHPYPNLWLGVTVENQEMRRIPVLLQVPSAVRFVSIEPMLGPIDFNRVLLNCLSGYCGHPCDEYLEFQGLFPCACARGEPPNAKVDWVICGGESGPKARPMHPDWARSVRDQCQEAGVPFFMKQMSRRVPIPDDLMVREWPRTE